MKTRKRKPPDIRVRVIRRPPIEARHKIEEGLELDAWFDTERTTRIDRGREVVSRSKYVDAVWIFSKVTGERIRLVKGEWEEVSEDG